MTQQVKDLALLLLWRLVQSLAWELLHTTGAAKKNPKTKQSVRGHWYHFFFFFFFCLFRAALAAYGGSQARGLIGAGAAGLRQSHSNARSKPRLRPTPQLMATLDP